MDLYFTLYFCSARYTLFKSIPITSINTEPQFILILKIVYFDFMTTNIAYKDFFH